MKKLGILACLAIGLFACKENKDVQVGFKTTMTIDSVYDGGKVAKGEMINATFNVKNTGESPLILSDVKGSCSCTVADWSKDPIAPGETGYIKAQVDTKNFSYGPVTRSITVLTNTTPADTKITVKANIIK